MSRDFAGISRPDIGHCPLPAGVQMQRNLAGLPGMQPGELRTNGD
jgi:hypothetical protein